LVGEGVTIISATPYDELITAEASIGTWERVFGTEFHEFVHENWKGSVMNRALQYSLSEEINEYVESVFEVADFPALIAAHPVVDKLVGASPNPYPSRVSPSFLLNHYDIDPSIGNSKFGSQAILSCIGQVLSPADLLLHQSIFGLPNTRLTNWTGGHVDDDACKKTITNCDEANLDVQYITAVGQNLPTYNYYDEKCDWLGVVKFLTSLHNPPTVLSISYSSYETDVGSSLVSSFNNIAQQLGIQGVTLFAASGDDGVSGFQTARKADCAYNPQFPASSPYVTSVGATQV
jgi:subtilase family serine protease